MMSKIKQCLKKNETIVRLYKKWQVLEFKLISQLSFVSPELVSRIRYKRSFGRKLDLNNPKYFNEKLMWLKLKKYEYLCKKRHKFQSACVRIFPTTQYLVSAPQKRKQILIGTLAFRRCIMKTRTASETF